MSSNALSINWISKRFLFSLLICLGCHLAKAQNDTLVSPDSTAAKEVIKTDRGTVTGDIEATGNQTDSIVQNHSPRKATIMSAALPGLGQVYNKKWWKVPIIYGGFAVAGYFLKNNYDHINLYKDAYIAATDDDPQTINDTGYNTTQLLQLIDTYKQWRDLSYISIAVIYALNIIDANVDAHLFYFDVSDDISLNVEPWVSLSSRPGTGITLSFKF